MRGGMYGSWILHGPAGCVVQRYGLAGPELTIHADRPIPGTGLGVLPKEPGVTFRVRDISRPGLVGRVDGVTAAVVGIDLTEEGRIGRIWLMMHSDKLHAWHNRDGS
ncbi:hypothetical protein ACFZAU_40870 [Streptomyces sp. NPDC008238]